ncbi:MAG: T9SS type A sorting domain-containing protein [Saprospiraceae bacterium]
MQKYLYILTLLLLSVAQTNGQGWERIYGGSGQDAARSLAPTPDGGYIIGGYYNSNNFIFLIKTDVDGKLQWSKQIAAAGAGSTAEAFAVVATKDTGYVIAGYVDEDATGPADRDIYLLKTDAFGNKLWDRTFGGSFDDEARAMKELADGSLVLTGFQSYTGNTKENIFALKTDSEGNLVWFNTYGQQEYRRRGHSILAIPNGDFVIAGESKATLSAVDDKDVLALRINASGVLIWNNKYSLTGALGNAQDDEARSVTRTVDGSFVLAGITKADSPMAQGFLLKIDENGSLTPIWQKLFPSDNFYALASSGAHFFATGYRSSVNNLDNVVLLKLDANGTVVCEAVVGRGGPDAGFALVPVRGGAVIAGSTEQFVGPFGESYAYLVKADENCTVLTSYIQANIFRDFNANCQKDLDEPGLRNWVVKVESPSDTLYTVANANGDLKIEVDTGVYNLVLFPPNPYWKSCDTVLSIHVPNFYDTVYVDVPARTLFDCPRNEVDVMTPVLRRCVDNTYSIRYCNSGTVPSLETKVEVTLDPFLTLTASSITAIPQGNNVYLFDLGTVNNGDCGDFTVTAFLNCDDTQTGQAHCVTALITPIDSCGNNTGWDGAIIAAKAFCENDSVKMQVENIGLGNMSEPLGYVITEDIIMLTPPGSPDYKFDLDAGQSQVVWATVATGGTFRIIAEQSPGYPGTSYPTAAVEGCLTDTSTNEASIGFYTMFPEDDADAFIESDCQESNDSDFNPLYLKRGHPKGYDVPHYVSPQTDLDFVIQFQNTGADTVQQVVIRDTLSAALDPATVYPGAASHHYQFDILGGGIVEFTLSNLNLLPGGGAPSEGFVKFRVSQKLDLPCETTIFNSAAIYFDFNAPVFSNTTYHTVCDSFIIITDTKEVYVEGADVKVFPNPATESVNFKVEGIHAKSYALLLYDIQGRLIFNQFFDHSEFRLLRQQIPAGKFIYQLAADGKLVASGKIIVN